MVRDEFKPLIERAEKNTFKELEGTSDSSDWTGVQSTRQRLVAIKTLAPVAQASIESLIATLGAPNQNGGPPLDEHRGAAKSGLDPIEERDRERQKIPTFKRTTFIEMRRTLLQKWSDYLQGVPTVA